MHTFKREIISLTLFASIVSVGAHSTRAQADAAEAPALRHLFIDDADIAKMHGLKRALHQPRKYGAVLHLDGPWVLQIRSAPMWDEADHLFKMVYLGSHPAWSGRFYATSRDGLKWDLPDLGRAAVPPNAPLNRVVVQSSDPRWQGFDDVVYDPDEPDPSRRFKALLGAIDRLPAVSGNGYDYVPLQSAQPISSSDESQLVYDRARKRFIASVKQGNEWGRAVAISTSADFQNWTPPKVVFGTDEEDQRRARQKIRDRLPYRDIAGPMFVDPEPPAGELPARGSALVTWACDVYNMAVVPYEGLYIGLPSIFYRTGPEPPGNNTDGFHEIQLVVSRDLEKWDRVCDRQPFISGSLAREAVLGIYDRNGLFMASEPLVRGDELWFYYTGIKYRTSPHVYRRDGSPRPVEELAPLERADFEEGGGAICLAVLRRDGFVSLDAAGTSRGFVESKPIRVSGNDLWLNLDASGAGDKSGATVALLDAGGKPIAGFGDQDCIAIGGDQPRARVQWKDASIASLAGNEIRVRITLENARLYSFWTE